MIACIRIPAFATALEERDNARLAGKQFVLVEVGNPAGLAAAASRLLDDPGHRAVLASAAMAAVREFDWSVIARDVLRVYEAVVPAAGRVSVAP